MVLTSSLCTFKATAPRSATHADQLHVCTFRNAKIMADSSGCTVLLTDDDKNYLAAVSQLLELAGYTVKQANSGEQALEVLARESEEIDIALLDIRMPGINGIETLEQVRGRHPSLPVIMLTGEDAIDLVVSAMKAGAVNYVPKTSGGTELLAAVKTALEEKPCGAPELEEEHMEFAEHGIIGSSRELRRVLSDAANCARSGISVLITGETGVGKDLLARAIHEMSPRNPKEYVALDVPNIPASMFESELFGHTKGAFTGASDNKKGMVQEADGGTLFLDEIGEFPIELQAKFLRVLDTGSVRKLGSTKPEEVDIRIVSATNRDLLQMVGERKFREDLFYRLRGIEIHIPPLRARTSDIRPLALHFLKDFCERNKIESKTIVEGGMLALEAHGWPGNIRELRRTIEAAVILSSDPSIDREDFERVLDPAPGSYSTPSYGGNGNGSSTPVDYADVEERARQTKKSELTKVLERNSWNITRSAAELDIDRSTLSKQMKNLGITKPNLGVGR